MPTSSLYMKADFFFLHYLRFSGTQMRMNIRYFAFQVKILKRVELLHRRVLEGGEIIWFSRTCCCVEERMIVQTFKKQHIISDCFKENWEKEAAIGQ